MEVQKRFVDRAQLLDVEGGIAHPPPSPGLLAPARAFERNEGRELEDRVQEVGVGDPRLFEIATGRGREEIAVEGREAELGGLFGLFEGAEEDREADPEIGEGIAAVPALGQIAQPAEPVPALVDPVAVGRVFGPGEKPPLLGGHQEQEPVDEGEELSPIGLGGELAAGELLPQCRAVGMAQEALAQAPQRRLDPEAQPLLDPAAFLDRLLVPALEPAGVIGRGRREARAVEEAEEEGEVGVELGRGDRLEVDLEEGLAGGACALPEDAQPAAVGDDAPQEIGPVEQLLDQGVRREALAAALVELLIEGGEVDRDGGFAVRNRLGVAHGEGGGAHPESLAPISGVPAELAQDREQPSLPGDAGPATLPHRLAASLEGPPVREDPAEDVLDLVGEAELPLEAEGLGLLALLLLGVGGEPLEEIGIEETALDRDRCAHRGPPSVGKRTTRPRRSGGLCGRTSSRARSPSSARIRAWAASSSRTRQAVIGACQVGPDRIGARKRSSHRVRS